MYILMKESHKIYDHSEHYKIGQYSKPCLERPLKNNTQNCCCFNTDYRLMQVKSITECSKAFCNTFDLHFATILVCLILEAS